MSTQLRSDFVLATQDSSSILDTNVDQNAILEMHDNLLNGTSADIDDINSIGVISLDSEEQFGVLQLIDDVSTAESPNHQSKSPSTVAATPQSKPFPICDKNQKLIIDSKKRIRNKFDQLEKRLDLPSPLSDLRISDGDLSLEDLGSSIETTGSQQNTDTVTTSASKMDRELALLTQRLRIKEGEVEKLCKFRAQVELELDELTASLFQEANRMVWEAKSQKARAEKSLKEANMKIDVLQAEVKALKSLVLNTSSTISSSGAKTLPPVGLPSSGNKITSFGQNLTNLKSNLSAKSLMKSSKSSGLKAILQKASLQSPGRTKSASESGMLSGVPSHKPFSKSHPQKSLNKRSPSNYELGGESQSEVSGSSATNERLYLTDESISISSIGEIDSLFFDEFKMWRNNPMLEADASKFMRRLYAEDIRPLFDVNNPQLTDRLIEAITRNNVIIEMNSESSIGTKLVEMKTFVF
jgi:hypothetical protein